MESLKQDFARLKISADGAKVLFASARHPDHMLNEVRRQFTHIPDKRSTHGYPARLADVQIHNWRLRRMPLLTDL